MYLGVVIEVHVDIALVGEPIAGAPSPDIELVVGILARVQMRRSVQPYVDEVGRDLLGHLPAAGAVGNDEAAVVLAQNGVELIAEVRRMTDFECMTISDTRRRSYQRAATQPMIMLLGNCFCCTR